jgi:hypothetical protein
MSPRLTPVSRPALAAKLALLGVITAAAPALAAGTFAVYDGDRLPIEALSYYDEVLVNPGKVTDGEIAALKQKGRLPLALVVPGAGKQKGSDQLATLEKRGFVGYAFDGRRPEQATAAEELMLEARRRTPAALIYYWGSIDRLPSVAAAVSGFITDGVFTGGVGLAGEDKAPEVLDDLEGVRRLASLVDAKSKYRFPFVVIERVPNHQREQARGIARTLAERGFVPWVQVGGRMLGVGLKEWIPRRILALYDGEDEPELTISAVHRLATVPLEYLGYAVDYHDVNSGPLPAGDLSARYAGIVSWFSDDEMAQPRAYEGFIMDQLSRGMKVAFLGRIGFIPSSEILSRLGMAESTRRVMLPVIISHTGAMVGFEARPFPLGRDLPAWISRSGEVHLEVRDQAGARLHPVVTGLWGGMALDPYVLERGVDGRVRWIINPFTFFARALDLEPIPAPDFTTENGRRLLFVHIDGDSFASMAELPGKYFSGQIVMREFLERYPLPTTVSIVEGETSVAGAYPQLSTKLEPIAKEMFRLPNVEVASHSFSHPFDWVAAAQGLKVMPGSKDPVAMPIPNYKYNAAREVGGSAQYINALAPPDKPVKVFLWSGAAEPGVDALKEAYASKLANMNGGSCEVPGDSPTLSQIPSLGRWVGGYLQIYAQAQNENVYTNEWHGPFYGFRDVIRMFRFTESPRRLKPINIYYHFYSGTKAAAITALHEVYQYAMGEETLPIMVSEMVPKVQDFYRVNMARHLDGTWELRGMNNLRTVRLDKRLGWPNLADSAGVIGVEDDPQGRYVALSGASIATLALSQKKPTDPHLVSANATVQSWSVDRGRVKFRLKGHQPVKMSIGGCSGASGAGGAKVRTDSGRRLVQLSFPSSDTREVTLSCR